MLYMILGIRNFAWFQTELRFLNVLNSPKEKRQNKMVPLIIASNCILFRTGLCFIQSLTMLPFLFLWGKGVLGTGTCRNSHKGSHPLSKSITRSLSFGAFSSTLLLWVRYLFRDKTSGNVQNLNQGWTNETPNTILPVWTEYKFIDRHAGDKSLSNFPK